MVNSRASERSLLSKSAPGEQVWRGISLMLDQYIGLNDKDLVLLLYALDAREPTAWVAAELDIRNIPTALIDLNTKSTAARFMEKLNRAPLVADDIGDRLVVLSIEYGVVAPSAWIRKALERFPSKKVDMFRMVMAGQEFFEQGVTAAPATLNNINAGLLNKLRPEERFRIRTSSGTDLDITLDPNRYRWVSNRGVPREGAFVFLPAGEVATYPAQINGTLVADGAFNTTAHTKLDARLQNHPAVIEIENGMMVNYRCENGLVEKLIERCLRLPNASRVGELGFGTNIGIQHFVPLNSHLNERHPGVHIGFGQNNQVKHVLYECDVHLDLIASDCTIEIEGKPQLKSEDFKDLSGKHPTIDAGVFDEDLDGDCCGLFSSYNKVQCR